MKLRFASLGLIIVILGGCAQAVRGDADQVYVDDQLSLTDAQGIDEATKHCQQFGKIAVFRGQYSGATRVFACVYPSGQSAEPQGSALAADINALRKAADLGDADAMAKLGAIYSGLKEGAGAPDYAQSMFWLHRAADLGNSNAMALIGAAYIKGQIGVSADPSEAMRWLTKASNLGNAPSIFLVGAMFDNGMGVRVDKTEAARWYLRAANLGNVDAMKVLANMYEKGIGVSANEAEAKRWRQKSTPPQN